MQLTCPACNARFALESALTDAAAREAVAAALKLPAPLGDRLLRYIGLFRPRKQALAWSRATRLLTELNELITAGEIQRNGAVFPAPLPVWRDALDAMLAKRDKLRLPLTTHGYLLEIVAGVAEKARDGRRQTPQPDVGQRAKETKRIEDIIEAQRRAQWDRELGIGKDD